MLFHSPGFILAFLPAALLGYYHLGRHRPDYAIFWLLSVSLFFYFLGNGSNVFLLVASMGTNFYLGRKIGRLRNKPKTGKALLTAGLLINLGVLFYYKSNGFFITGDAISGQKYFMDAVIPLGLSFFTLQQIAFLVDTFHGKIKETRIDQYALFVGFFPQLIAGPIVRYQELVPQLARKTFCRFQYENLSVGSTIFILGALKKVLIADSLSRISDPVFHSLALHQELMLLEAWIGAVTFCLQLYFDFSSYSDMAIGIARMFGLHLPVNFNSPLKSPDMGQWFLRWHITLYRFFTDYLFAPLVTLFKKVPLGKNIYKIRFAVSMASMTIFCLSGLWHGLSWKFFLWGFLNGLMITGIYLKREFMGRPAVSGKRRLWMKILGTFCLSVFFTPLFRCADFGQSVSLWKSMIGLNGISLPVMFENSLGDLAPAGVQFLGIFAFTEMTVSRLEGLLSVLVSFGIVFFCPNIYEWLGKYYQGPETEKRGYVEKRLMWQPTATVAFAMALAAVLLLTQLVDGRYHGSETFIYFHF